MQFEFLPDWIYTFLILPIAILFQRHYSNSSRITKIETNQKFYVDKVEKIYTSNEELQKEVHEMIGRLDEHLKK